MVGLGAVVAVGGTAVGAVVAGAVVAAGAAVGGAGVGAGVGDGAHAIAISASASTAKITNDLVFIYSSSALGFFTLGSSRVIERTNEIYCLFKAY
jgi:hypothetical protein